MDYENKANATICNRRAFKCDLCKLICHGSGCNPHDDQVHNHLSAFYVERESIYQHQEPSVSCFKYFPADRIIKKRSSTELKISNARWCLAISKGKFNLYFNF